MPPHAQIKMRQYSDLDEDETTNNNNKDGPNNGADKDAAAAMMRDFSEEGGLGGEVDYKAYRKALEKRVRNLLKETCNKICSECRSHKPKWMALIKTPIPNETVGVFCCHDCSEYFLLMNRSSSGNGVKATLKSLKKPEVWEQRDVEIMERTSNLTVNAIYEPSNFTQQSEKQQKKPTPTQTSIGVVIIKYTQCHNFTPDHYYKQLQIRQDLLQEAKDAKDAKENKKSKKDKKGGSGDNNADAPPTPPAVEKVSVKDQLLKALQRQQTKVAPEPEEKEEEPGEGEQDMDVDIDEDSDFEEEPAAGTRRKDSTTAEEEARRRPPSRNSSFKQQQQQQQEGGSSRHNRTIPISDEEPTPTKQQSRQRRRSTVTSRGRISSFDSCGGDGGGGGNTTDEEPTPRQRRVSRLGNNRRPTRRGSATGKPKLDSDLDGGEAEGGEEGDHDNENRSPPPPPPINSQQRRASSAQPRRSIRTMGGARDRISSRQSFQQFVGVLTNAQPDIQKALSEMEESAREQKPLSSRERASRLGRLRRTKSTAADSSAAATAALLAFKKNKKEQQQGDNNGNNGKPNGGGLRRTKSTAADSSAAATAAALFAFKNKQQQQEGDNGNNKRGSRGPPKRCKSNDESMLSAVRASHHGRRGSTMTERRGSVGRESSRRASRAPNNNTAKEDDGDNNDNNNEDSKNNRSSSSCGRRKPRDSRSSLSKSVHDGRPSSRRQQEEKTSSGPTTTSRPFHKSMSASDYGNASRSTLLLSEDDDNNGPNKSHERRCGPPLGGGFKPSRGMLHRSMSASDYGNASRSSLLLLEDDDNNNNGPNSKSHERRSGGGGCNMHRSMSASEYGNSTRTSLLGEPGSRPQPPSRRKGGLRRSISMSSSDYDNGRASTRRGGRRSASMERPKRAEAQEEKPEEEGEGAVPSEESPAEEKNLQGSFHKGNDKRHSRRTSRQTVEAANGSTHKRGLKGEENNRSTQDRSSHKRGVNAEEDNSESNKASEEEPVVAEPTLSLEEKRGSVHRRKANDKRQSHRQSNKENNGSSHKRGLKVEDDTGTNNDGSSHKRGLKPHEDKETGNKATSKGPTTSPKENGLSKKFASDDKQNAMEKRKVLDEVSLGEKTSSSCEDALKQQIFGNFMSKGETMSSKKMQAPDQDKDSSGKRSLLSLESNHRRPALRRCNSENTMLSTQCVAPSAGKASGGGALGKLRNDDEGLGESMAENSSRRGHLQRSASDRITADKVLAEAAQDTPTKRFMSAMAVSRDLKARRESEDMEASCSSLQISPDSQSSAASFNDSLLQQADHRRSLRRLRGHLAASNTAMIVPQKPVDAIDRPCEMKRNHLRNSLRSLAVEIPCNTKESKDSPAAKNQSNNAGEVTRRRPVCTFIYS